MEPPRKSRPAIFATGETGIPALQAKRSSAAAGVRQASDRDSSSGAFVRNDRVVIRNALRPNSRPRVRPRPPAPPAEPDGITSGGYQIHSSIELGYRSTDVTGSGDMYDTLVNLQTGPRILDQTLTMQSVDHQGLLFDDLYLNSFGWGGDPEQRLAPAGGQEQVVQPAKQFPSRSVFL